MGVQLDSLKKERILAAWLTLALALILAILGPASEARAQVGPTPPAVYKLLPGDQVQVRFPLNSELDTDGPIGPDGRFSVPLLGRVMIAGLSLDEAESRINRALFDAGIAANARTSVSVANYAGVVYVGGEVARPGSVPITAALNPLQAITEAGGLLNTAKSRKIAIIRPNGTETAVVQTVNMREFARWGRGGGGLPLQPGDILFVPKSAIAEINVWIDQHINKIIPNALNLNWNFGDFGAGPNASVSASTSPSP
jgi:polysaccharide biosynthesis/export protein PslD